MDIFKYSLNQDIKHNAPLAERMRPATLDEFVGQDHILAKGRLLRRAIQADQLSSLIFYGPPGTGKTTLARIIANTTQAHFLSINAVLSGVKEIRECINVAKKYREEQKQRTILFIDEVHRFNKSQQDALLPHVENGIIILIGATTENPYFEVNKALVSRSRIFELHSLNPDDLALVAERVLSDPDKGYGNWKIDLHQDAKNHLCNIANGDARALLNALELAIITSDRKDGEAVVIDLPVAEESIQKKAVLYDKDGDSHYDTISAFIKSLRGSDTDAALYWMAKMIYSGEDPKFIFRRMIILAGEDVGMADPQALQVVMSAAQAFDYVGMPEGRFHLAQACLYLATAPKSNSAFAFFDALSTVKNEAITEMPNSLKDGNRDKKGFGHGEGYLYPHAYKDHWVSQQYLPNSLQGRIFYEPSDQGFENSIRDQVARRRETQLASMQELQEQEKSNYKYYWEDRTLGNHGELLEQVREIMFHNANLKRDSLTLNLNAGNGLLLGETLRRSPDGSHFAQVFSRSQEEQLSHIYGVEDRLEGPTILNTPFEVDSFDLEILVADKVKFDLIMAMNLFSPFCDKQKILTEIHPLLSTGGEFVFCEQIPAHGQRLSEYLEEGSLNQELRNRVQGAENLIYQDPDNSSINWDENSLINDIKNSGFQLVHHQKVPFYRDTNISSRSIDGWFLRGNEEKKSYGQHLETHLSSVEIDQVKDQLLLKLVGQRVKWRSTWCFYVVN
ncbi:MAG: AAA family ATPase [Proteobacteria bacterium]|nr:AAA family ATPase [Pseudomonadota bacterium]